MPNAAKPPAVLLFDVNETLLDLTPLNASINSILLVEHGARLWFTATLHYALAMTAGGQHAGLPAIGAAVLQMLARQYGVPLSEDEACAALAPLHALRAHPDARPALERLRGAGFRLAALTNSTQDGVRAQLAHARLDDLFERQLSVEGVGRYKPHRAVYEWAVQEMGAPPAQCMLAAAHGWDVAGAKWAGLQAAFIGRAGQQTFPLAPAPDLHVIDLDGLATALGA